MPITSIEEEEQIIQNLEELDSTFSLIKGNLRRLKKKIDNISEVNKRLTNDLKPWINFFESKKNIEASQLSETQLSSARYTDTNCTPDIMGVKMPKNPFIEQNSSDLLNKPIVKNYPFTESSSTLGNKSKLEEDEDTVPMLDSEENNSSLSSFSYSKIPEIFHQEKDVEKIYEFIAKNKSVSIDDICKKFTDLQPEKLEIFINLLCRKKFIKPKKNFLTIEE